MATSTFSELDIWERIISRLVVLDPKGDVRLDCDAGSELLEDNASELHWTSAGPHWNERGIGLFFDDNVTRWWCFRTSLGRQIVASLDRATLAPASALAPQLKECNRSGH